MFVWPSFLFTSKAVVDKTPIHFSTNWRKTVFGNYAKKLYPVSMCQMTPPDVYTRWVLDFGSDKFKPRREDSKTLSWHTFWKSDQSVTWKLSKRLAHGKKTNAYSVDDLCGQCNTVFEAMGCYYHNRPRQEALPSLTGKKIQRGLGRKSYTNYGGYIED